MSGNRTPIKVRFDLLIPEFLRGMAETMHEGHINYDDDRPHPNWQYGLSEDKTPINHAYDHLTAYHEIVKEDSDFDTFEEARTHLFHLACNAMMEYWLLTNVVREPEYEVSLDTFKASPRADNDGVETVEDSEDDSIPTASTFVEPPLVPSKEKNILEKLKEKLGGGDIQIVSR